MASFRCSSLDDDSVPICSSARLPRGERSRGMVRASEFSGGGVLLVVDDGPAGLSFLRALETVTSDVEWVRSAAELRLRAARLDLPAPDVVFLDLDLSDAADAE